MSPEDEFRVMCGDGQPLEDDPDFREVEPEPVVIGMDFGKEPGGSVVADMNAPAEFPSWVKEAYLEKKRQIEDGFFRDMIYGKPPVPEPKARPIVVVGSYEQSTKVAKAHPTRWINHVESLDQLSYKGDFDFVVYDSGRMTMEEGWARLDLVHEIRKRPGARQISVEEAEGRVQWRPGTEHVADLPYSVIDQFDLLERLHAMPAEKRERLYREMRSCLKVPALDPRSDKINGMTRREYVEKHGLAVLHRQQELARRREPGLREHEQEQRDARMIEKYCPKASVKRIDRGRRADAKVPATVHESVHNLGTETGNGDAYRMGFKQDLGDPC